MNINKKILITGGTGMVGSAFKRLKVSHELICIGSRDFDLYRRENVVNMFNEIKPDAVIHLAAKVGGVKSNMNYVADYFDENIIINSNVLTSAKDYALKYNNNLKVLSLLSTCIYPDNIIYPLTPDKIHLGPPHESNFGYAYAKRMLDIQAKAIRKQYNLNWISAVPNNIYGEHDNFSCENSHVIPAIIRKIYDAKLNNTSVELWGSGSQLREFTYSGDIAEILIWMIENYECEKPLNIGCNNEISLKKLSEIISDFFNYPKNMIKWDTTQPSGQHRKPSSSAVYNSLNPNYKYTSIEDGINKTCKWFLENYPNIRK